MITNNPLNNILSPIKKPDWCCEHDSAKIIDIKNKVFSCDICTKGLTCKFFYHEDLHTHLNKKDK
jgi:hypothetical protein